MPTYARPEDNRAYNRNYAQSVAARLASAPTATTRPNQADHAALRALPNGGNRNDDGIEFTNYRRM